MLDGETLEQTTFIIINIVLKVLFNKVMGKFKSEFFTLIRQNQFLFSDDVTISSNPPKNPLKKL